jgi:quercetin dioxygenase-like cupin family protein
VDTVYGGRPEKVLRQTLIGMTRGARLAKHENPGEATVQVLQSRVRMIAGELSWEARTGDLLIVPDTRHSLEALEDAADLPCSGIEAEIFCEAAETLRRMRHDDGATG